MDYPIAVQVSTDDKKTMKIEKLRQRQQKIEQQQQQIKKRIKQIENQESKTTRKNELRKKILIGAAVMRRIEKGVVDEETVKKWMAYFLTRNSDRELFGLELLPDPKVSIIANTPTIPVNL